MIAGKVSFRNQQGRLPKTGDFIQAARTTPADYEIANRVDVGDIMEVILAILETVNQIHFFLAVFGFKPALGI